jgi:hypothetical protein
MQVAGTMIGAAGEYTFSGVVQQSEDGRFFSLARVFDHPDPSVSLPSGTTPRHVVSAEGDSFDEATRALESALAVRLGPLQWVRWRRQDGPPASRA